MESLEKHNASRKTDVGVRPLVNLEGGTEFQFRTK
jgi:hypothetical protein